MNSVKHDSTSPVKKRRKARKHFLVFAFIGIAFILFRVAYDVKTWLFGSSVIVRRISGEPFDYLVVFPPGYHDFTKPKPLLVYLHGAGDVGKDVRILDTNSPHVFLGETVSAKDFPFVMVCPSTPINGWDSKRVITFLDQLLADHRFRYRLDPDRVYLTGLSMGGFGTFSVACDYPDRFAAIAPLAGGGDPEKAECLSSVPTWAFHDEGDHIVAYECTSKMIDAMNALGNREVKFTTLHDIGHNIAPPVYADPKLYQWLLEHRKKND